MDCDPDCVDQPVPKNSDGNPFRTLLSEPICVVTEDMTYQEKIEDLSGTIYDYHDVIDNTPVYFDYDDQLDYEEWGGWNDPQMTIALALLIIVTHMFVKTGVPGMVGGLMGCVVTPTAQTSLIGSLPFPGNRD